MIIDNNDNPHQEGLYSKKIYNFPSVQGRYDNLKPYYISIELIYLIIIILVHVTSINLNICIHYNFQ